MFKLLLNIKTKNKTIDCENNYKYVFLYNNNYIDNIHKINISLDKNYNSTLNNCNKLQDSVLIFFQYIVLKLKIKTLDMHL